MVHLDDEEKGILRYLGSDYGTSLSLDDISKYLKDSEYEDFSKREISEKLDNLIEWGYVRAKTEGKGNNREEKFYLSKSLLGGRYKRRDLQGRGIIHDTSKLVKRLIGSFVLAIAGISVLLTLNFGSVTGNIVGSSSKTGNFLGVLLILVGIVLFVIRNKK